MRSPILIVLASLLATRAAVAQTSPEPTLTIHGRRHHDGCVNFEGALGWHGLPAGDETVTLPATRERAIVIQGAPRPRGLHADEDDSARARLEAVARGDMRHVLEQLQPRVVARLGRIYLPSGERWLHLTSHVGVSDDRAVFQAHIVSSPHTPLLGSQTENLVVDTRQCPIAYHVPSPYGPVACEGRRIEIEIGPRESPFPGVVQYVVVDDCFDRDAHGPATLIERSYVVRGSTRSFFPLVSERDMRAFVVSLAEEIAWHTSNAIEQVAGVRMAIDAGPSDLEVREATHSSDPLPASTPPAICDAAITRATARYFTLVHALEPGPEPVNAQQDRLLETIAGSLRDRDLAALGGVHPPGETPGSLVEVRARLANIVSEITHASSHAHVCPIGYFAVSTDATHGSETLCERFELVPDWWLPSGPAGPPALRSLVLQLCQRRTPPHQGELSDGIRDWVRCSELRFAPAPHIVHAGSVIDTLDDHIYGSASLAVAYEETHFTPIEAFVGRALILEGIRDCAPRIRPLRWLDVPDVRRRARPGP